MRTFLISLFVLSIAACAGKSVYTPVPGAQAVSQERAVQKQMAGGGKGSGQYGGQMADSQTYLAQLKRIAPRIQKVGVEVCQNMGRKSCSFGFKLQEARELNAFADGKNIYITTGMMAFAGNDDDIAVVLAHEYAHNVLAHVASTQKNVAVGGIGGTLADALLSSQGINTGGQFAKLGANYALGKYSKTFEQEADHVGLFIADRAGFPLDNAPAFWRRMSVEMPQAIYTGTTHPTNPERYVGMSQTIAEIQQKKASGQPVLPALKK